MTTYVNIGGVEKAPLVILTINGVEHPLKPVSVEGFLENVKAIEELALNASPVAEVEVLIGIILRGFPTLKREDVLKWDMLDIQKISLLARSGGGELAGSEESIEKAHKPGNSQPAT